MGLTVFGVVSVVKEPEVKDKYAQVLVMYQGRKAKGAPEDELPPAKFWPLKAFDQYLMNLIGGLKKGEKVIINAEVMLSASRQGRSGEKLPPFESLRLLSLERFGSGEKREAAAQPKPEPKQPKVADFGMMPEDAEIPF